LNNTKNIFIAIAPNHISNFENIIRNNHNIGFSILLNPGNFKFNNNIWSQVINGEIDLRYTESNRINKLIYQVKKLVGYKLFIKKLHKSISNSSNFDFYYCNLDDILTNYIFHYLVERNLSVNNYVVEDGILNYYYPQINSSKLKAKKFFCEIFFGIKFVPEVCHPTSINSNIVKAQYVRLPNKAIYPEKSLNLPFEQINYNPIDNVILIIGQDIMHNSPEGSGYYKKRVKTLFKHIAEKCEDNTLVVYKPHRNGDYRIAESFLKSTFSNFKLYKDITPIEECITKIKPKKIFSFESSAILNLKIAFNRVNVYITVLPYSNKQPELTNIFKDLGIKVLQ